MEVSQLTIKLRFLALAMLAPLVFLTACGSGGGSTGVSLASMNNAKISTVASTVPSLGAGQPGDGDVNPYGVAIVGKTTGNLTLGNILVSNFNNKNNLQGTGSTIVEVTPQGAFGLFAQIGNTALSGVPGGACPGGVGLTTALVALKSGWVIVGSLPTTDGMADTIGSGCLIVLNSTGLPVETISGSPINGPWDMTAAEVLNGDGSSDASLFVTNVLNGTVAGNGSVVNEGTVVRVDLHIPNGGMPSVTSTIVIGSGFSERTDPAALVIGPTGVGLSPDGSVLYVADSLNNRIQMIADPLTRGTSAGTGTTFTADKSLNDPLGLAVDGAGNVFTSNGNDGFLLAFDPAGKQFVNKLLDNTISHGSKPGAGSLFGLGIAANGGVYYVNDATNTLNFLR